MFSSFCYDFNCEVLWLIKQYDSHLRQYILLILNSPNPVMKL